MNPNKNLRKFISSRLKGYYIGEGIFFNDWFYYNEGIRLEENIFYKTYHI